MAVIAIPKSIRDILGDEGSDDLVEIFDKVSEDKKNNIIVFVEEKFERRLTEETSRLDKRISEEVTKLDKRITDEMAQLRSVDLAKLDKRITEEVAKLDKRITEEVAKLDSKISETKADIIKWMFIFWAGQIFAMLGILLAFFRK